MNLNIAKDFFNYNPDTGSLSWKKKPSNRVPVGWEVSCHDDYGYLVVGLGGVNHKAHRIAWLLFYGEYPKGQIDHINGTKDDNRILNLRSVTQTQNQQNKALPKNNTSGVMGVSWRKDMNKWHATIRVKGKTIHIGYFSSLSKAKKKRMESEVHNGFHPNHGRSNNR